MSTQHAPGPFTAVRTPNRKHKFFTILAADGVAVAEILPMQGGQTEANASLFKAAPELLEACKVAMADINTGLPLDGRTIDALAAAISKAEGESP